jgi:hypothetical protein
MRSAEVLAVHVGEADGRGCCPPHSALRPACDTHVQPSRSAEPTVAYLRREA